MQQPGQQMMQPGQQPQVIIMQQQSGAYQEKDVKCCCCYTVPCGIMFVLLFVVGIEDTLTSCIRRLVAVDIAEVNFMLVLVLLVELLLHGRHVFLYWMMLLRLKSLYRLHLAVIVISLFK